MCTQTLRMLVLHGRASAPPGLFLLRLLYVYLQTFFFFNDTATTEIYTLSLHDALPIYRPALRPARRRPKRHRRLDAGAPHDRSEEHTSELQSRQYLVCRLLLEKKKNKISTAHSSEMEKKPRLIKLFSACQVPVHDEEGV